MKKTVVLSLALIVSLMFFITGCTNESTSNNHEEIEDYNEIHEPVEGGMLNLSVTRFNTLNPLFNQNYSVYQLHHLVYESLLTFDEEMNMEPLLATEWVISEDGQSVELTLREGVKWHDGKPLTADDIIFTIDLIKGNIDEVRSRTTFTTSLQQISDVREIEQNKIRITFTRPFSNALEVLTFPIMPKHQFTNETIEVINSNKFEMIGTGPYKVENYDSTRVIELAKHGEYWKDKPYIDKIKVVIVPDEEAQLSLFENKEVDIAQPNSIDWAKYLDDSSVNLFEYVSNHFEFIGFNFRNTMLKDNNLRRAIAYGIDRHKLVNDIYLDHGTVTDVPIMPMSWLYDGSNVQIGNDLSRAIELLEDSNYILSNEAEVRVDENGTPLKFRMLLNNDNILREKKAYFIREELEKLDIELDLVSLDWEEYEAEARSGNYDLILGGWELSFVPDLSFAFHSTQIGSTNFINYNDEVMDELIERAFSAPNRERKLEVYRELQDHILDELPYLVLFFKDSSVLIRNNVHGNISPTPYNVFYGIEEWFISGE